MRSAKDLKGMVQDARIRGKSNNGSASQSRAITEDVDGENVRPYDSMPGAAGGDSYNFVRNKQVGGAAYATAGDEGDTMKKLRKLEVLAQADKETIES